MAAIDRLFNRSADILLKPQSPEELVALMDAAGIEVALLTASTIPGGMVDVFDDLGELCVEVGKITDRFPTRFVSVPLIGPVRGLEVIRGMRTAVREYGARGFHIFPAIIDRSPCDALLYPLYAEAADLGVPMVINVGVPGPLGYADLQRPGHLDRICIDFPELQVVAAHIGAPWQSEVAWLLAKHENLFMMTSAWAPKWYPEEILAFMRSSRGRHKVMYASDFPVIAFDRAMSEMRDLDLDDETRRAFLRDNAARIFSLNLPTSNEDGGR